jgi:hypothetical protein
MANPYQLDLADYQSALEQFARPARIYKKDANAYNTALTDYQGKVKGYNATATAFNDTFYRDPSGAQAGMVGGQWTGNAPANKVGYGLYTDPTNTGQQFLRKPDAGGEKVSGVLSTAPPVTMYFTGALSREPEPSPRMVNIPGVGSIPIDSLASSGYVIPDLTGVNDGQKIVLQKANFSAAPVSPGEFTQKTPVAPVAPVAPEGTLSQMQGGPSASQALSANERGGLISDVIQGRGVR